MLSGDRRHKGPLGDKEPVPCGNVAILGASGQIRLLCPRQEHNSLPLWWSALVALVAAGLSLVRNSVHALAGIFMQEDDRGRMVG